MTAGLTTNMAMEHQNALIWYLFIVKIMAITQQKPAELALKRATVVVSIIYSYFMSGWNTIIFNKYSLHYLAIFLLVVVVVWVEELPNTMCSTFTETAPVATQQECQSNCAQDSECVGILYSYKLGSTHHCYVCKDDNFLEATNHFGFYRRPGNVHGYKFNLFITYYIYLNR